MGERGRLARAIVAIGFSACVLTAWLARALYGRWIADDYCFATMAWRGGFWHAQKLMYLQLNGRISVSFLMAVVTSMGRFTTPAMALLLMIVWLIGAWTAVRHVFALADARVSRLEEVAGALLFVAVILSVAPDSDQPLIWLLGLMTYGTPIICMTWMATLILRSSLFSVAILAFVAGGCSEVAAAAQIIFLFALLPFAKRFRSSMIAGALASAMALFIESVSSGNAIRRALFTPLPIPAAAAKAIAITPGTIGALVAQGVAPFMMLIVFFAMAGSREKVAGRTMAIAALLSMLPIFATTLLAALYGTGRLPWGRVQFVPIAYATVAFLIATFALPQSKRRAVVIALNLAVALLAIVELGSTAAVRMQSINDARQFATVADGIDRTARVHRGGPLVVQAPREFELLEFVSPDPDHWTNRCMASYYGLTSIRTGLPSGR